MIFPGRWDIRCDFMSYNVFVYVIWFSSCYLSKEYIHMTGSFYLVAVLRDLGLTLTLTLTLKSMRLSSSSSLTILLSNSLSEAIRCVWYNSLMCILTPQSDRVGPFRQLLKRSNKSVDFLRIFCMYRPRSVIRLLFSDNYGESL